MKNKIAVIGGGSWGTALALQLHRNGYQVLIQDVSQEKVTEINQEQRNSFLPNIKLPSDLKATTDLKEAVKNAKLVVVVVPSHVMRTVAKGLKGLLNEDTIIVSATKGLEEGTNLRMTQVLKAELFDFEDRILALSGPTHAEEVVLDHPSTVVVAHRNKNLAQRVQDVFMSDKFRVYTNPDIVGVELGATVKNSIAIAAGIADGLGYGDNAISALVTRGITEIKRLGVEMGAKAMTFAGLTGLGDLVVTCTSQHSRNRRLGHKIGSGYTLEEALDEMQMIAEGVKTTKAVYSLAQELGVEMPIVNQVYQILFAGKEPKEAVNDLMLRGKKHEIEAVAKMKAW
ncbi:glycerol-3-phosphate dehydrogenase [Halobacteroides halobius DSM 5150]|uniref:Glycerol-3-phosphate dehydrogenase [NAD(P)+] n=1 Tax=Halobacteroides halobius (strain ATCC 35273 / DSM 5150 / MD-1) TaxID=748449 RepID=L0KBR1_HALHC|nr:NAD(P)H-dependent glycerol-3-phosphate dehydrogenase [Halobacteroides halobius]AGB41528.1 glycerol-3-phosphate dehydrogenase [Halobacteroides halobius DSM 5150]